MAGDDDDQDDLFDRPPFVRGSDTSEAAADSVAPLTGRWRLAVYGLIAGKGDHGATCDECEALLGQRHQNVSARVNELHNSFWIVDSGRRRPTRSGRAAVVWVAVKRSLR